ncbi:MAG: hypothetical protein ACKVS5_00545 [Parvularculaceae bacterium]
MTGLQAIGVLIIRLWAATVVMSAVASLTVLVSIYTTYDNRADIDASLIENGLWLGASLAAWAVAPKLSSVLVPRAAPDSMQITIGAEEFVAIGSFLIGANYLVEIIPDLIASVGNFLWPFIDRENDEGPSLYAIHWQSLFANLLTFAAALFLTLRPREIARMFASLRQAGLTKIDPAD